MANRDGGGFGLPGTGSPRRILALERWMQHEITAYQRTISADESRPKATARLDANFLTKPTVSLHFYTSGSQTVKKKKRRILQDIAFGEKRPPDQENYKGL